ncbi:MAG: urease accessory UreF family protein [Alphaproteobacteria bacterium]|jgi:urease accessory protein|nr:urease accessory UreF family protein [Alphaproteobacteria bacterium]
MDEKALYPLMAWLSPGYPVGAYSYSHALEAAVEQGLVHDRASLHDWLEVLVSQGDGWVDACFFRHAYDAAGREDWPTLTTVAAHAGAQRPTPEIALESEAQGEAFLLATSRAWPHDWLDRLPRPVAYPVAVAVACAAFAVPRQAGLVAYLHGFVANLASAGMRLVPLGQSDGQAAIADLALTVQETAERAPDVPLDEIGSATPMVDVLSIAHETQYVRLFRS